MSNAVDIIMVGGVAHGKMVCMSRLRLTSVVEFPVAMDHGGLVTYSIATRTIDGKVYRFGYPEGNVEPSDEAILAAGVTPAWDLNRG